MPLWQRWLTILACVLLVAVMSTVQVCHTHHLIPQPTGSHQNLPSSDHCPLCIAMHSAMPASLHIGPEPVIQAQRLDSVAADADRPFRWHFQMACRPPPSDISPA